ncbi:MAG: hypothetical protein H6876_06570 [Hyphomicrobiaceae bacterium]|nr:hypothetical protein [Hyphomicrobiaceae bacterium]MCC0007773.1 hypothetical protein [Hyphomicrobiaceae bacterium]
MVVIDRKALKPRVEERYYELAEAAEQLKSHEMLSFGGEQECELNDVRLLRATEAYFLLSEAYKKDFGIERTEPPKIAAMTALTLVLFRPLVPKHQSNVRSRFVPFANEILSLSWAARPLGQDFSELLVRNLRVDGLYRYFRTLRGLEVPCLSAYHTDMHNYPPTPRDHYDIRLNHDTNLGQSSLSSLPAIELMILIFELIWDGQNRKSD